MNRILFFCRKTLDMKPFKILDTQAMEIQQRNKENTQEGPTVILDCTIKFNSLLKYEVMKNFTGFNQEVVT